MKSHSVSTTQLAKICGVSQGTVDRALNNRPGIKPETKARILAAAKSYGYRPNIHARSMAGGKSMLIGVVVFDLNNPYFSDILTSITNYCSKRGYSTVVMFTDRDPEQEIECIQNLYHMSVDGIVLSPVGMGEEYENFLLSLELPIVTIGNRLERFPYAGIDNQQAMQEVIRHVLAEGYDHLIYVKPNLRGSNTFGQDTRLFAFLHCMQKEQIDYVITDLAGAEAALLPGRRNALICPTDILAIQLLHTTQACQAGIIGFDNIRLIDTLELKLDSVDYDHQLTAQRTVDYILDRTPLNEPISHQIIKRGSI